MTKFFVFISVFLLLVFLVLPVGAATADETTPGEATPDYNLNILDDSISWLYVLIAVVSVVIIIAAAITVAKKIK